MDPVITGWQKLRSDFEPQCPKLFYSFTGTQDGYTVKFTDLVGFWTAVSSAVDLVDYAKITKASIDPSDRGAQYGMLLQKLAQSLAEGTVILRQDGDETEAILLQTTLKLPKPLQPLKWEFYIEPRGAVELGENILRPCLFEASDSKRKIDSLQEVIKAKDHVISKLMDKIEGTTIDLSTIFPGITGARSRKSQTTIKDAEKHVPGLKAFNKQDWLSNFHSNNPYADFEAVGLSQLVIGCEKCPKHETQQHDRWLSRLPKASASASQAVKQQLAGDRVSSDADATASDTDSDEFETQRRRSQWPDHKATPNQPQDASQSKQKHASPLPRSSSPLLPQPPTPRRDLIAASTSSTSTLGSESEHPDKSTTKSRLGTLGKKRSPGFHQTSSPPLGSSSPAPPRVQTRTSPISSSPPPLPNPRMIGRRPESSSSTATLSSLNPVTPPKRRLGRLGDAKETSNSASATPEHKRGADIIASQVGSTQVTPSHRLGRLKRGMSHLSTQQYASSETKSSPMGNQRTDLEETKTVADDSDASTASTASSASPSPTPAKANIRNVSSDSISNHVIGDHVAENSLLKGSQRSSAARPTTPEPELTKDEKAAKRREELKRKIAPSSSAGLGADGSTAVPGLRKKRKF